MVEHLAPIIDRIRCDCMGIFVWQRHIFNDIGLIVLSCYIDLYFLPILQIASDLFAYISKRNATHNENVNLEPNLVYLSNAISVLWLFDSIHNHSRLSLCLVFTNFESIDGVWKNETNQFYLFNFVFSSDLKCKSNKKPSTNFSFLSNAIICEYNDNIDNDDDDDDENADDDDTDESEWWHQENANQLVIWIWHHL